MLCSMSQSLVKAYTICGVFLRTILRISLPDFKLKKQSILVRLVHLRG